MSEGVSSSLNGQLEYVIELYRNQSWCRCTFDDSRVQEGNASVNFQFGNARGNSCEHCLPAWCVTLYQEIDTLGKSIGRGSFSWSYDQDKSSLQRCVILSKTKSIEKVLFKFLFFQNLSNSLAKVIWSRFMARISLLWENFPDFMKC